MSQEDKIRKWKRWLGRVREDTEQLLISREIYIEVRNIIAGNPAIRTNNRFFHWMTSNYAQATLISVRRLVDPRKDVVSLRRLLDDMEINSHLLRREAHASLYSVETVEGQADWTFDNLAGEGMNTFPVEKIRSDIETLNPSIA